MQLLSEEEAASKVAPIPYLNLPLPLLDQLLFLSNVLLQLVLLPTRERKGESRGD